MAVARENTTLSACIDTVDRTEYKCHDTCCVAITWMNSQYHRAPPHVDAHYTQGRTKDSTKINEIMQHSPYCYAAVFKLKIIAHLGRIFTFSHFHIFTWCGCSLTSCPGRMWWYSIWHIFNACILLSCVKPSGWCSNITRALGYASTELHSSNITAAEIQYSHRRTTPTQRIFTDAYTV